MAPGMRQIATRDAVALLWKNLHATISLLSARPQQENSHTNSSPLLSTVFTVNVIPRCTFESEMHYAFLSASE